MSSLSSDFQRATKEVRELKKRPSNSYLLQLYAYYKQGTEGDVTGKRPGRFSMKQKAKYDAWASKRGMSKLDAQSQYVKLVKSLKELYR